MQRIHVIDSNSLSDDLMDRWRAIQGSDPVLANPFLCPEFTQCIGAVRDDVEVAVLERDGEICGFFPFQRGRANAGQPVGGHLSNYQALIVGPHERWSPREIVAACGLSAWDFDNFVASQNSFAEHHHLTEQCGVIDLSDGFDAYVKGRRASRPKDFSEIFRKERKLARDVGPVRLAQTTSREVLQELLDWKTAQCESQNTFNLFGFDWTLAALAHALDYASADFRGMLTVLEAGGEKVAITYDLVSRTAADGWLIAFNPKFAKYSPGLICILRKAEALAAQGVERFYLGRGGGRHKETVVSSSVLLAEGTVDRLPGRAAFKRGWVKTREWLRTSRLRQPAKSIKRLLDPIESKRLAASESLRDQDGLVPHLSSCEYKDGR